MQWVPLRPPTGLTEVIGVPQYGDGRRVNTICQLCMASGRPYGVDKIRSAERLFRRPCRCIASERSKPELVDMGATVAICA